MKVLLHVNYYEGVGKLDTLLKLAKTIGYDGVELRWKYRFSDMNQEEYLAKVATFKLNNPEMEIVFGGAVNFCRGKKEEVEKTTGEYVDFLGWAAKECGTKVMNFFAGDMVALNGNYCDFHTNGSAIASDCDYERAAKGL
ncbi:MAG: hypothetical protein WC071_03085, partial [Victivallaceae bacterium]